MSPIDLGAGRNPSPAQEIHDLVDDVDAEETETINVDEDSRTDRRLNWSVEEDKRLVHPLNHFSNLTSMSMYAH